MKLFRRKQRTPKQRLKQALLASGALVVVFTLTVVSLGAAWLAGYKVPLASGFMAAIADGAAPSGDRWEGSRSFRVADPDGRQVAVFFDYPR